MIRAVILCRCIDACSNLNAASSGEAQVNKSGSAGD